MKKNIAIVEYYKIKSSEGWDCYIPCSEVNVGHEIENIEDEKNFDLYDFLHFKGSYKEHFIKHIFNKDTYKVISKVSINIEYNEVYTLKNCNSFYYERYNVKFDGDEFHVEAISFDEKSIIEYTKVKFDELYKSLNNTKMSMTNFPILELIEEDEFIKKYHILLKKFKNKFKQI